MTWEHKENSVVSKCLKAALKGKLSPDGLTEEEHEIWAGEFMEKMACPSSEAIVFYADPRHRGIEVGMDGDRKFKHGLDK